jgi:DNA modification methylase
MLNDDELYRMYLGDNVEQMKLHLPDESIDMVCTSPPYDNIRDYKGFTFNSDLVIAELFRVMKPGGVVMWNVADATINGSESLTSFKQAIKFVETGFKLHDTMIAEKGNFSNPSSNRYHQIFEYMFIFSKGKLKTFNPIKDKRITNMDNPDHARIGTFGKNTVRQKDGTMKDRGQRKVYGEFGMRTNIWRYRTAGQLRPGKPVEHPAKMSYELARDHIISWSNPGEIVLDPFCGSGTTGVEALKLGRKFIGIEIAQEYFDMSVKNLEAVTQI